MPGWVDVACCGVLLLVCFFLKTDPSLAVFLLLSSRISCFFSFSFIYSLDDRGELVLIPWDEQRHREMDWCEAEECR